MQTSNSIFHPAVATYINAFEPAVQEKLLQLRSLVYTIVPEVEEGISYKMPCYKYKGGAFLYGRLQTAYWFLSFSRPYCPFCCAIERL